jgi:hypothetical protein
MQPAPEMKTRKFDLFAIEPTRFTRSSSISNSRLCLNEIAGNSAAFNGLYSASENRFSTPQSFLIELKEFVASITESALRNCSNLQINES